MRRRRNPPPPDPAAERVILPVSTPGVLVEMFYVDEMPPEVQAARRWFVQRVRETIARQRAEKQTAPPGTHAPPVPPTAAQDREAPGEATHADRSAPEAGSEEDYGQD